jgi:hypothetical protein
MQAASLQLFHSPCQRRKAGFDQHTTMLRHDCEFGRINVRHCLFFRCELLF